MIKSPNNNRLDKIEVALTPKEWAIKLAGEIHRYPREHDFLRAVAKGTYYESPYIKPFCALDEQAEDRHSGQRPENLRARQELSRKLRKEYHALKTLINDTNGEVQSKTEMSRLKLDALATKLHGLILRDAMALASEKAAAVIESNSAPEPYEEKRQLTMKELEDVALVAGSRAGLFVVAQEWADDAAMLLLDILVRKAAVQTIQEKYYDGHAILHRDIEEALESTIQLIVEAVATFNEYVSTKPHGFTQGHETINHETCPLRIDVEAIGERASGELVDYLVSTWVTEAKYKAIADILKETNEHGNFIFERFRAQVGAEP